MKKLLVILALLSTSVQAQTLAYTINKNGGKIVITTEQCRDGKNRLAYSQSDNAPTILGCWVNDENFIHIQWYDSELRSYSYEGWQMAKKQTPKPNI